MMMCACGMEELPASGWTVRTERCGCMDEGGMVHEYERCTIERGESVVSLIDQAILRGES